MEKKNNGGWTDPKVIISIIGLCGLFGFFLFSVNSRWYRESLIENYGQQTVGVIYDKGYGYKRKIANYKFQVDGKIYLGSTIYYDSDGDINIGDQFIILYYPDDPEINKLQFNQRYQE